MLMLLLLAVHTLCLAIVMQSLYSPSLQIDHGDCGLFWLVLDLHIYICESMIVLRSLLLLLVVVVDSLIAWLINWPDCLMWLIDLISDLPWYWTNICTTVKACLFWTYWCCCCCCLIPWLLWLIDCQITWLIDHPISQFTMVMVVYFDLYWTYICTNVKACLFWAYLLLLLLLLDCLIAWMSDCQIAWLVDHPTSQLTMVMVGLFWFVLDLHMYNCEIMFVLSFFFLLLLLLYCLTALTELHCQIAWLVDSPYLPINHGDGGLFWFVLDLHMYKCESMFVLSLLLLLLLDCLIA